MSANNLPARLRDAALRQDYPTGVLMMEAAEQLSTIHKAIEKYPRAATQLVDSIAKLMPDRCGKDFAAVMISPLDIKGILEQYQEAVFGKEAA